ncbi:MAG: AI-2E family transporter [Eubacteriales bacterium]
MNTPTSSGTRKYWVIAFITLCVVVAGIAFYFMTANLTQIFAFGDRVNQVLRPIYYGLVLAFLLLPIHRTFYHWYYIYFKISDPTKKKKFCGALSIFSSLILTLALIYLFLALLIPELYLSIQGLFQSMPEDFTYRTPEWLQTFFDKNPELYATIEPYYVTAVQSINNWIEVDFLPQINSTEVVLGWLRELILPNISNVVSSVSHIVVGIVIFFKDLLISIIVSVYILARKEVFAAQTKKLLFAIFPVRAAKLILSETRNAYKILSGFIIGKVVDSIIVAIICLICCNIFNFPYEVLIATIIGVTNIIPFFGPFIGAVPCTILILMVNPIQAVYFVLFIIALQQFDGNILGPKILGESTGLASFWVLFSIILFGGLFGFPGMLLGVPVFATFYSMVSRLVKHALEKKNLPLETQAYSGQKAPILKATLAKKGESK